MIKLLLVSITIILLSMLGCSKPSATPTPATATPTPTFEQRRVSTVEYLRAFNKIDNDGEQVVSSIKFPSASARGGAAELLQFNSSLAQLLTAYEGYLQRLDNMKVPDMDEVRVHFQASKKLVLDGIGAIQGMQRAVSAGSEESVAQAFIEFAGVISQGTAFNRSTESLMLKYNIPDSEVDYRFRGR